VVLAVVHRQLSRPLDFRRETTSTWVAFQALAIDPRSSTRPAWPMTAVLDPDEDLGLMGHDGELPVVDYRAGGGSDRIRMPPSLGVA
jgi:hypothetical protein